MEFHGLKINLLGIAEVLGALGTFISVLRGGQVFKQKVDERKSQNETASPEK